MLSHRGEPQHRPPQHLQRNGASLHRSLRMTKYNHPRGDINLRPLQNAPFCPISASDSNCNPRNTLCMDACPDGFFIGVVKIFAFPRSKSGIFDLNLNKNEHFSKVAKLFLPVRRRVYAKMATDHRQNPAGRYPMASITPAAMRGSMISWCPVRLKPCPPPAVGRLTTLVMGR